jgi:hypothetical protein
VGRGECRWWPVLHRAAHATHAAHAAAHTATHAAAGGASVVAVVVAAAALEVAGCDDVVDPASVADSMACVFTRRGSTTPSSSMFTISPV